jgi:hypothetical protein
MKLVTLLKERRENFEYLKEQLDARLPPKIASRMVNKNNKISLAIELHAPEITSDLGSELFLRNVSGARIFVRKDDSRKIDLTELKNFGAHTSIPIVDKYLNAACALGTSRSEIDLFIDRLLSRIAPAARPYSTD